MIIKTNILNPVSTQKSEFIPDVFISISRGKISSISKATLSHDFIDHSDLICIPGLIDTHVHLSQFYIRGSHSPNLLHWLNTYTFAEEFRSKEPDYARKVAQDFFRDSIKKGTTTSVIYTAPFKQACDIAFEVAQELGVRAVIGKTMMDSGCPDFLKEDTNTSFKESVELFEKWNKKTDLLEYIFSPRFALTCSADLMQLIGDFAKENDAFIQTHLSENNEEINTTLQLFPDCETYTAIYRKYNLLGPKTILGHVLHVDDNEIDVLRKTNSKVVHCPDSNFFLKSGMFPLKRLQKAGVNFALASDVAGGTSLSMFNVMKMCSFRQNDYVVSPQEAFYYATLGGAKVLGKENIIGSVEEGKDADLVFLKIPEQNKYNCSELLSKLIYVNDEVEIISTMVAGRKVFGI